MNHSVPIPLEDELASGVLGRFAKLNGIPSINRAISALRSHVPRQRELPTLWLLAQACGFAQDEFESSHSMTPVLYPISGKRGGAKATQHKQFIAQQYGLATTPDTLRWCVLCSSDDFQARGFSHWRRKHQIAGIDWCTAHRTPLSQFAPLSSACLLGPPAQATALIELSGEELCSPALRRLEDILCSWLQRRQPIHLRAWNEVIGQRCRHLGLRVGEIGKRDVASDWIRHQFPAAWLHRYMPEIATKEPSAYVRKVDGACVDKHLSYRALACAAILAVLYETAQEGLAALDDADSRIHALRPSGEAIHSAVAAFLAGEGLQKACVKAGANLAEVEVHLRNSYLEFSSAITVADPA